MSPTTPLPQDPSAVVSVADAAKPTSQSTARPFINPYLSFHSNPYTLQRLPWNPNPNFPHLAPRTPYQPLQADPTHQFMYSGMGFMARPGQRPPMFAIPYLDRPSQAGFARPSGQFMMMPNVMRAPMVNSQHQLHQLKGGPPVSVAVNNGHKDLRDRSKDDNLITVRDRKVRITENASIYSLCRSWLRNGVIEETQPQFPDFIQPLPKPLPSEEAQESPEKDVRVKEEEEQAEESVENLSTEDLLQRHIKRAKRARSRIREDRQKRIARYKTRLGLLLQPPMAEQQLISDPTPQI